MDHNYWIVFVILIAIMLYTIITVQWTLGIIACLVVIVVAGILSQVQHWGKTQS